MPTFSIATLGCKVNQYESEALTDALEQRGYTLVPFGERPEVTLINTCTVTHRADFQSRQMVRRALRSNPESLIIVTGCYSQVDPGAFDKMKGTIYLLGNKEKKDIPDLLPLMRRGEFPRVCVGAIQNESLFSEISLCTFHRHTRAFLKIQDGCNAHCSYCIVPYARGRSRSLPPERVIEILKGFKAKGFKEVVLTGIHLGTYGLDFNLPFPLTKLLQQLEQEETPLRIRLSSFEPGDFSPELISMLARSEKICPHLHLAIQSGEDEILKKMNRDYDQSFLIDLVQELHRRISGLSIGADIITGFPGETDEQYRTTYKLVESLPFSYLHIFPFSRRKLTPASQFPQQVDGREIKKRAETLRDLGKQKRRDFYRRFLNQSLNVLVEGGHEKGKNGWKGLSRNYIPVLLSPQEGICPRRDWVNQECTVMVTEITDKGVIGKTLEEKRG